MQCIQFFGRFIHSIKILKLNIHPQSHSNSHSHSNQCHSNPFDNYRNLNLIFWTLGSPKGVLSNRPCQSVRLSGVRWSVFKYLRDNSLVFSNFCMKLGHHKDKKIDRAQFLKNSNHLCSSVRPSLNISETADQFFLKLCSTLGVNRIKDSPRILKKILSLWIKVD